VTGAGAVNLTGTTLSNSARLGRALRCPDDDRREKLSVTFRTAWQTRVFIFHLGRGKKNEKNN